MACCGLHRLKFLEIDEESFSIYAGQVVFREALRQDDDKELSDMETFL